MHAAITRKYILFWKKYELNNHNERTQHKWHKINMVMVRCDTLYDKLQC